MEQVIKRALISVYYKEGLEDIVRELHRLNVEIVSTGGTKTFIEGLGIPCISVESLTNYPSMLGGRVKTLHPVVFGGILARRDKSSDIDQAQLYKIPLFDLVVVDLYPFEETLRSGATREEIIEKIDIGGISLIRAAAKNYQDVLIVSHRGQYEDLLQILKEKNGATSLQDRKRFAGEAFAVSSGYDTAIFGYFNSENEHEELRIAYSAPQVLRYGENPHQQGFFFGDFDRYFNKLQGKELSYNNLLDLSAATSLVNEFKETAFAVIKHTNPCGLAVRETVSEACRQAIDCDPESAFGGILAANRPIDRDTALIVKDIFFEVLVAPDFDMEALSILSAKGKRILLVQKEQPKPARTFRSVGFGVLVQDEDALTDAVADMRAVTRKAPTPEELQDLRFASIVSKHCKSNAVALVKDSCLCASGIGQTSRVSSLKQAVEKAQRFGFDLHGAVLASDAFFPFDDCVRIAAEAGVTAIIQPGGSIRDEESIKACDELGVSMVFTGHRHFRH